MSFAAAAQRSKSPQYHPRANPTEGRHCGKPIHHPHTSLGATGHWIHLGAIAAPLIIGEVIKDPEQRWRALRLATVGAAIASEAVWTSRLSKDRQKDEDNLAALTACYAR